MGKTSIGRAKSSNVYLNDVLIENVEIIHGLVNLGNVSGTTDVDMSTYEFFKAVITGIWTPNIINVRLRTPICFSDITGAFTINVPTSSGVTFNLIEDSKTYTSGASRLWIIFNTATQADYFYTKITV